ncbi:MAG: sulfite exporter TauE/SafE family protein, partial [Candidatus Krumholzibacteria bacterium]|nr:sulfite exporter TauE/SafE family protein [Candidatus Krumholzibacteria bacterium]
ARIAVYAFLFLRAKTDSPIDSDQIPLVIAGILAAFAGVIIGKRFIHKITMKTVQSVTGILLLGIALALGMGII